MFGWIRQILAGNHNPNLPSDAVVTRDSQGRISEVQVSLGQEKEKANYPTSQSSSNFQKQLNIASEALISNNIKLIQKGIGLETTYDFFQDSGKLILSYDGGRKIIAKGEIIASFDPGPGSFMWAWANPTISTDESSISTKLRVLGETLNEGLLLNPTQSLKFAQIVDLMAFAMNEGAFDGVYRAFVNGYVSTFIAYRVESFIDADGNDIAESNFLQITKDEQLSKAQNHCTAYDNDMFLIDQEYNSQAEGADMKPFLGRKNKLYSHFWKRDDDDWKPCSFSWPSNHDLKRHNISFASSGGNQTVLIGRVSENMSITVYRVEFFENEPKITDQLIEWGNGFIWPRR